MKELNFETGLVEYRVNGNAVVRFNPTDSNFVKRLFDAYETLDSKQEFYKKRVETIADKREVFIFAKEQDEEMRGIIDGLFAEPVSEAIFGALNVYALADGLPVWCNLMFAVMDEIDTSFAREQKATNPRLEVYRKKWNKQ